MVKDGGYCFWLRYGTSISRPAHPYGWIPSVLTVGALPSDLGPVLAQFLPSPPLPRFFYVLYQLCQAYSNADHDELWRASVMNAECRGERILAWYIYDDYARERWTVSHFDDGGFDLNPEPDEDGMVDHEHEIEFYDAMCTRMSGMSRQRKAALESTSPANAGENCGTTVNKARKSA